MWSVGLPTAVYCTLHVRYYASAMTDKPNAPVRGAHAFGKGNPREKYNACLYIRCVNPTHEYPQSSHTITRISLTSQGPQPALRATTQSTRTAHRRMIQRSAKNGNRAVYHNTPHGTQPNHAESDASSTILQWEYYPTPSAGYCTVSTARSKRAVQGRPRCQGGEVEKQDKYRREREHRMHVSKANLASDDPRKRRRRVERVVCRHPESTSTAYCTCTDRG
ncbi:hypothetical protein C7212DRAFT_343358 [Tuber magnatum]|uniref:Uncharacterized protein n=1 Tax=Tuber magnatum TaxID=42249 RepID=A0A317SWG0_9PEZI|nr:hypothetical protein C7212DRAFT_343358 [Tuber magnatum]